MIRTGVISDALWEMIEPVLPSGAGRRGRPWRDHRWVLEAIAWRFRTGCPWRDLPAEFGPWQTVWKRHRRWSTDGTYQRIFERVLAAGYGAGKLDELVSVDSTVVRAHQHAAGAPTAKHTGGGVE
jgi:putative transposase